VQEFGKGFYYADIKIINVLLEYGKLSEFVLYLGSEQKLLLALGLQTYVILFWDPTTCIKHEHVSTLLKAIKLDILKKEKYYTSPLVQFVYKYKRPI
jgi:hypothetical protein